MATDFVLKYPKGEINGDLALHILWFISKYIYDWLKFCIFAWLGSNPDYAPFIILFCTKCVLHLGTTLITLANLA